MNYPQEKIKPYSNDGKKSEQVEQMSTTLLLHTTS